MRTARLVLRPFAPADAPRVQELVRDPAVADTTLHIPHPYPDGAAEAWIAGQAPAAAAGSVLTLAVTERDDLRGAIGLTLRLEHRRAEAGYWIGRPWWNRGFATEALRAVLDWAFVTLPLDRIDAVHFARNAASGRVMTKAGMTREAEHRRFFVKNGRSEDVVRYVILRHAAPGLEGAAPTL